MKNNRIFLVLFCLIIFGGSCLLINKNTKYVKAETPPEEECNVLKIGMTSYIQDIDPLLIFSMKDIQITTPVIETLFTENVSDPEKGLIPCLASDFGTWSPDKLFYTISLKSNVIFQDGGPVNATAIKWNFDRLAYFMNVTGQLGINDQITHANDIYRWEDGTPIINSTQIINEYTIRFILNRANGAFESLLSCITGTGILSPYSSPNQSYLTKYDQLVGTGPFILDSLNNSEIVYHVFPYYHRGIASKEILKIKIYENHELLNDAFVEGIVDINLNPSDLEFYRQHFDLVVQDIDSHIGFYIGMNNAHINTTTRRAISYALNYSEFLRTDQRIRLKSPLPKAIRYSNWGYNVATTNITKAREILVDSGVCNFNIYDDLVWINAAESLNPVMKFNFTTYYGTEFYSTLVINGLKQIGIKIDLVQMDWKDYVTVVYDSQKHHLVDLFFTGWGADFNDPTSVVDKLFHSSSINNMMVSDPYLDYLIESGLHETDRIARKNIYNTIQQYVVEDLMPCAFLWSYKNHIAHHKNIVGIGWRSFGEVDFFNVSSKKIPVEKHISMKFGLLGGLPQVDPIINLDLNSYFISSQFLESLLMNNLTDPSLEIIPCLATELGEWSEDGLNYTISLKQDVKFHDGTELDAFAVKWNFDRREYFMNLTGDLPPWEILPESNFLFFFEDGVTPIINRTEVINPLTIRFVLNRRYVPLESLLTTMSTSLISPYSTPQHSLLSVEDDIYGTGPFVYDGFNGSTINFHAFKHYHSGLSNIDLLTGILYNDANEMENAYFASEIDFCLNVRGSQIEQYQNDANTTVLSSVQQIAYYIGINNNFINKTMRQAISYAFNYSHMMEILGGGKSYSRLTSPYPSPSLYSYANFDAAIFNVTRAREILVDAGICNYNIYSDDEWILAANNNPIMKYNFTTMGISSFNILLGTLLTENLASIGINITIEEVEYEVWLNRIQDIEPYSRDDFELFFYGWGMDFNDPSNFDSQYLSTGSQNVFQVNDSYIDSLLTQARIETNHTIRKQLYLDFQQYIVEDLMPSVYLFTPTTYVAYNNSFTGFHWNSMNIVRFIDVSLIVEVETPEGLEVEIYDDYHALNLTFDEISQGGTTTVVSSNTGIDPEDGFGLAGEYYEISTTAEFSGTITICLEYDEDEIQVDESELRLMHWDDELEEWVDITTYVDTINNLVYGETTSFSMFSILQPDYEPPSTTMTIRGIEGANSWFTSDVYITLSAKDILSDIQLTEYSFDGITWFVYSKLFPFDTSGITQIYYRSTDEYGNIEEAQLSEIKIDKRSPTSIITLDGVIGENGWYTSAVDFTIDSLDDYSGVYKIEFSTDGVTWQDYYSPKLVTVEGYNTIYYRAVDFAGNVEIIKSTTFKIDTCLPEGSLTLMGTLGENNWYTSNVTVSISGIDLTSGISTIEYGYDGENWNTYLGDFEITEQGETKLFLRLIDNAGLIFSTSTIISIDYTPPTTELFITDGYTDENGTIFVVNESMFIVVGMDNESLVLYSYYSINNSEWVVFVDAFDLTGYDYGNYVIRYYSTDLAGNAGLIQSTFVEFVEEIGITYIGWGMLVVNGDRYIGDATMTITDTTIEMEIEDVVAQWDITGTWGLANLQFIYGNGEIGWIRVLVFTCGDTTYIIAVGKDVFFMGSSTT
ncbi:MAG: ABC transporter substrate-binding protein [Candidatus Lokiarchaeota archaeon]|nr:ABC transporter substrate-binding protein [Candidatus Lokiarchaeota archaeon]